MNRKYGVNRLGTELALAAAVSAVAGILLFMLLNYFGYGTLDRTLLSDEAIAVREKGYMDRLQEYVTEYELAPDNRAMLDQWADGEKNLIITVCRDGEILYSNGSRAAVAVPYSKDVGITADAAGETDGEFSGLPWSYEAEFADGRADVVLSVSFEAGYYTAVSALNGFLSLAVFMILVYAFIRRKVRYIALIERETQILKGGDLDYPVTVKGKDELASLAAEIDAMRRAVKERQAQEDAAGKANRDLVTAMSHDLRTPLTALLGYADILRLDRCKDEEQRRRAIQAISEKACQIKEMSDKMFEYFLVYGKDQEEMNPDEINGAEFLAQVVEESLFDLENEGFQILRTADVTDCRLMADIALIRRVFGNIFSNLLKYADRSRPVTVEYLLRDGKLTIRFTNFVAPDYENRESSSIGLKTCEKIMDSHGGSFLWRREEDQFVAEITLAVQGYNAAFPQSLFSECR